MENIRVTSQKPDLASWAKITQDAHGARPRTCCDITCCWRAFPSAAWRSSRRMPDVKVDTQLQYSCLHMAATKARQASLPPGRPPALRTRKHAGRPPAPLWKKPLSPCAEETKAVWSGRNRCLQPPVNPVLAKVKQPSRNYKLIFDFMFKFQPKCH